MKTQKVGLASLSPSDLAQLKKSIERWLLDPVAFVLEVFAPGWESAHPDSEFKLEKWHEEGLAALPKYQRVAAQASKGVGKTAFLAWVGWWFLLCHQHSKGAACSITGANLKSGLWAELALWQSYSPLLSLVFEHRAERISAVGDKLGKTWFLDSRTFQTDADASKQNESMAGLHNDNVFVLLDEVGAYPLGVFKAAQGIFTDKNAIALMVVAGNCNDEDGPLGVIARDEPERWKRIEINGDPDNPNRCTRVDINEAREEIRLHGRDDAGVRINILGLFPKRGTNKLLGPDDVSIAMMRDPPPAEWKHAPVIFGLDAAFDGGDANVLAKRQGSVAWLKDEWIWRGVAREKVHVLADAIADILKKHPNYGAVFIDITGGWGNAVFIRLTSDLNFPRIIPVEFASDAIDPQYFNRRSEMHFLKADWVKAHGSLPKRPGLRAELCAPGYKSVTKAGRSVKQIEPKKDIKARLGRSPDEDDALALTFAAHVYAPEDEQIAEMVAARDAAAFRANPYQRVLARRS